MTDISDVGDSLRPSGLCDGEVDKAIRQHDRTLVRWLARKLGDIEIARDIAQSAYLRVWRYAQSNDVDNFQALLFKTAANLAANEFRARKRRNEFAAEPVAGESDHAVDLVPSDSPSPEAAAVTRDEVAALLAAIESLPLQAKRAFVMSRFEEKTYREIASILRVSESSVEKYIISALKSLRAAAKSADGPGNIIPLFRGRGRL